MCATLGAREEKDLASRARVCCLCFVRGCRDYIGKISTTAPCILISLSLSCSFFKVSHDILVHVTIVVSLDIKSSPISFEFIDLGDSLCPFYHLQALLSRPRWCEYVRLGCSYVDHPLMQLHNYKWCRHLHCRNDFEACKTVAHYRMGNKAMCLHAFVLHCHQHHHHH